MNVAHCRNLRGIVLTPIVNHWFVFFLRPLKGLFLLVFSGQRPNFSGRRLIHFSLKYYSKEVMSSGARRVNAHSPFLGWQVRVPRRISWVDVSSGKIIWHFASLIAPAICPHLSAPP